MKQITQPPLSAEGLQTLNHYAFAIQQVEDLSPDIICNYLSYLCQFIAWCECSWREAEEVRFFTPQVIAPPLLLRYQSFLQTTLWLKPTTVNRALMSQGYFFAWAENIQLIQCDPTSTIKFMLKGAPTPRHLSQALFTLFLHPKLYTQKLYTLIRQPVHLDKRHGTLHVVGKRKKVRNIPLNTTARSLLNQHLGALPQECQYLFLSEKTQRALTGRVLVYLIAKYAMQAQVVDVSSHDLRLPNGESHAFASARADYGA